MKKVFKVNFGVVMAVVIGLTTMSFQFAKKKQSQWHLVEFDATAGKHEIKAPIEAPDNDCELNTPLDEMCAIEYDPTTDPATYVEDLQPTTPRNEAWRDLP